MENILYFKKPVDMAPVLKDLKQQQQEAVIKVIEYLSSPSTEPYFLLQGIGGSGKSTGIKRAVSHLDKTRVIASAPSHFACNVLSESLGENVRVITVASLLGKLLSGEKGEKKVLINNRRGPQVFGYDIIIVDEISMIPDVIAKELLSICKNKKLILMGDYFQLMPVEQSNESILFKKIDYSMTEPIRFSGPIFNLSTAIRGEQQKIKEGLIPDLHVITEVTDRISIVNEAGSGCIYLNDVGTVLKVFIKKFNENRAPDNIRILAFRHKTINTLNKYIRKMLYGNNPDQYEKGEMIISNGVFKVRSSYSGEILNTVRNGQIFEVSAIKKIVGPYNLNCLELSFKKKTNFKGVIVLADDSRDKYKKLLLRKRREAVNSGVWVEFHRFIDSFADFSFAYATTTHKSQGSSINNVIVMEDDIMSVKPITFKEKFHALYTALTRAKFRLYIYNKKAVVDNSQLNKEWLKIKHEDREFSL